MNSRVSDNCLKFIGGNFYKNGLSILVVSDARYLKSTSKTISKHSTTMLPVYVHTCHRINEILQAGTTEQINLDYIVFVLDNREATLENLKHELTLLDKRFFLFRRICFLLNSDPCHNSINEAIYSKSRQWDIPVFLTNFSDKERIENAGEQIINAASTITGASSSFPLTWNRSKSEKRVLQNL